MTLTPKERERNPADQPFNLPFNKQKKTGKRKSNEGFRKQRKDTEE